MGSELGVSGDSKPEPVYNSVSIWWACWACIWTAVVVLGMAFLTINRHAPTIRIRGLGLSLSAIVVLHLYWISVQFGIMVGSMTPGDSEFWIMGLFLPFGLGLFYVSNSRFLYVAKSQKKYAQQGSDLIDIPPESKRSSGNLIDRFRRLEYTVKVLIVVAVVTVIEIFLTCLMYIISRKWHSSWGIPGTEVHGTPMEQKAEMGRGWEWWPTLVAQFLWAWVIAPIVLWKARNIHDTQGWRVQTIGCSVAYLHATPMWIIAINVPGMAPVNKVWLPPQWVCLSIMIMEIFTIFVPCWEVVRQRSLVKKTLNTIAQWEMKNKTSGSESKSLHSSKTAVESMLTCLKSARASVQTNDSSDSILTMGALEYALERNPTPLQEFSALSDFSGENIAFLTSVTEWKGTLPKAAFDGTGPKSDSVKELIRERFNRALRIYVEFISVRDAEFPINISFQDSRKLENIFERPARIMYGERREMGTVTPFDNFAEPPSPSCSANSEKEIQSGVTGSAIEDRVQFWGEVPEEFDETVFDDAEKSIKYLVLTNTWPKFIRSQRISISSSDGAEP